jgi:hypothetical protein
MTAEYMNSDKTRMKDSQEDIFTMYEVRAGHSGEMRDIPRNDLLLVEAVESLGEEADGEYAELDIVEIPDDIEWEIEEYDGKEWVSERHRTW